MPKMDERVHTRGRSRAALDRRFLGGVIAVDQTHHEPLVPMPGAQHQTTRSSQREAQDASHQQDTNLDLSFRADDTSSSRSGTQSIQSRHRPPEQLSVAVILMMSMTTRGVAQWSSA